jgi:hypothetical protein
VYFFVLIAGYVHEVEMSTDSLMRASIQPIFLGRNMAQQRKVSLAAKVD